MVEVRCPKCGSLMVLRTAKRGRNAGRSFYSCSRYPKCKETLPLGLANGESEGSDKEQRSVEEGFFPRTVIARTRFEGYQVRFFETVAVPENLLEEIILDGVDPEILKAFSQWRLDFPAREFSTQLTEKQRQIISVLEKILTRGRITLPSPWIEKELMELFGSPEIKPSSWAIEYWVARGYAESGDAPWLDSREEDVFYGHILREVLGQNYQQFVLPQVDISTLLPTNSNGGAFGYQRVDFAIFCPVSQDRVVVEIDGEQHRTYADSDKQRDRLLEQHGYTVIRIGADEVRRGGGVQLSALESKLSPLRQWLRNTFDCADDRVAKLVSSIKIVHQIQLALLQAIQAGFLDLEGVDQWHIVSDLERLDGRFSREEAFEILRASVIDFLQLLQNISKLYSLDLDVGEPAYELSSDFRTARSAKAISIAFSGHAASGLPTFYVQDIYVPFHIGHSSMSSTPVVGGLDTPTEEDLQYFLRYLFRKPYFWDGQYDGITRLLQGKDTLLLLPTGAGKSLVYQLASLLLPGRTVVVEPLISLMEDQIDNLAMLGVDRCIAITSQIEDSRDRSRAIELFGQGEYLFAYVAPERFQTVEFRDSLRTLTVHSPIALIVVDEAHCVSEWGHDFRTAYLNIGRVSREYCRYGDYIPPLVALTGTASRAVLKDVQRELQIDDFHAIITPSSFDRKELKFHVIYSRSEEKLATLKGYLARKLPGMFSTSASTFYQLRGKGTFCGLVFCPHVGGDFGVVRVADVIRRDLRIPTAIYSGKEPKHWDPKVYRHHKQRITKEFKRNRVPLLVCTKAFGMGIDKPNIRYTIHLGVPGSIESFYQEAGRAGRDRRVAHCCIIVSNDDPERTNKLLNPNTSVEEIEKILERIPWEENDDVTRVLYFHVNAFRGIEAEIQDVEEVLRHLGDVQRRGVKTLPIPAGISQRATNQRQARQITEKALHRLLLIGVVSDYTVDYAREQFTVKLSGATKDDIVQVYGEYVGSYLHSRREAEVAKASRLLPLPYDDFVKGMVRLLLQFIYDVIERGRRRAFYEMLLACSGSPTDQAMRERILRYLEATEYTEALEKIVNDKQAGIIACKDLFGTLRSPNEAAELRGQVSRYLESYPDHPALLMLRSLSEVFSKEKNAAVAKENFLAAVLSSLTRYALPQGTVIDFAAWGIVNIAKQDPSLARELTIELTRSGDRTAARALIEKLPLELGAIPAWFLLGRIQKDCESLMIRE